MNDQLIKGSIPKDGVPIGDLMQQMKARKKADIKWKAGKVWSLVYYVDENHLNNLKSAYNEYLSESYINPFAFKSAQQMEQEVIRMSANLFNGDASTVGTMTSGGTESIFLSVYTHLEKARAKNPKLRIPEIILPESAHPAFDKAAYILGIRIKKIPLDKDLRADPKKMEQAISNNTVLMVVSSPSYPHGIADPVETVAAIANKHQLPLHVDACIGGFMLPWIEQLGYPVPKWDFRVPGVCSISADLHKFGIRCQGCLRPALPEYGFPPTPVFHHHRLAGRYLCLFHFSPVPGPAARSLAAWTAMKSLGQKGYLNIARQIMEGLTQLKAGLLAIPEIQIIGNPVMNILAYNTKKNKPDIFLIAEQMEKKGWLPDRLQKPAGIHMTIMPQHLSVIEEYLTDLGQAVEYARKHPKESAKGNAALYGLMARIPFRGVVKENVRNVFINIYKGEARPDVQDGERENGSDSPVPENPFWVGKLNRFLNWLSRLFGKS